MQTCSLWDLDHRLCLIKRVCWIPVLFMNIQYLLLLLYEWNSWSNQTWYAFLMIILCTKFRLCRDPFLEYFAIGVVSAYGLKMKCLLFNAWNKFKASVCKLSIYKHFPSFLSIYVPYSDIENEIAIFKINIDFAGNKRFTSKNFTNKVVKRYQSSKWNILGSNGSRETLTFIFYLCKDRRHNE